MSKLLKTSLIVLSAGLLTLAACDFNWFGSAAPATEDQSSPDQSTETLSKARQDVARIIPNGSEVLVEIRHLEAGQDATRPFTWTKKYYNSAVQINTAIEYDLVTTAGDTDYLLSMRVHGAAVPSVAVSDDAVETGMEFNFRAVNRYAYDHLAGSDYNRQDASFPSNDSVVANRSLVAPNTSVAIIVQGLQFSNSPEITRAYMNFPGPTPGDPIGAAARAFLLYMRDNGSPDSGYSGRFFLLPGAVKGPKAMADTASTADDGNYYSVQVKGDNFNANSTPASSIENGAPGAPYPIMPVFDDTAAPALYHFADLSNYARDGVLARGRGGFVLVIDGAAFTGKKVVADANVMLLADPANSGYNEVNYPAAFPAPAPGSGKHNPVTGASAPAGVHELSCSVYFTHY